jgi:hypothetical protein
MGGLVGQGCLDPGKVLVKTAKLDYVFPISDSCKTHVVFAYRENKIAWRCHRPDSFPLREPASSSNFSISSPSFNGLPFCDDKYPS